MSGIRSEGAAAAGAGDAVIEKTVTAEVSLELAGVRKDGTFEALLGYGRVLWKSPTALPDGSELRSDRKLPAEKAVRAAAMADLVPGHTSTAILVEPSGVCRGATEDSLEYKARTTALGLDRAEAATLPIHLAAPRMLREYGRVVAALPVPKEPLAVGGTFGIATPVGEGTGRSGFYASQMMTVLAVEADAVVVEGKGRVLWAVDEKATYRQETGRLIRWARANKLTGCRLSSTRWNGPARPWTTSTVGTPHAACCTTTNSNPRTASPGYWCCSTRNKPPRSAG